MADEVASLIGRTQTGGRLNVNRASAPVGQGFNGDVKQL